MSDDAPSEKEKSVVEEKDEDTAKTETPKPETPKPATPKPGTPSAGSKAGSKPGSAKSVKKPSSAKSTTSARSGSAGRKSPKSRASSGKKTPTSAAPATPEKKKKAKKPPPPPPENLVPGCKPLFMASQSQGIFKCVCDEDVTEEEPYILLKIADIKTDFFNRAAISDFHPFKQTILDYPGEEILIYYDPDFKHGQNFVIATTEEAKNTILHPDGPSDDEEEDGEGGVKKRTGEDGEEEEEEEEDTTVYTYIPPVSKPWESQGSELEIEEESLVQQRKRINMTVRRVRKDFGVPIKFSDRNVNDAKDGLIDCVAYEDKTFDLKKLELDKGTQAIPSFVDMACQTDWRYPRNATTQYYPREFTKEQQDSILQEGHLKNFVTGSLPRFELAMQQNEIMNVFYDDWMGLADADSSFGSKADNHLKEYQSFTDLQFSKDKSITCIEWHPNIRGIVAVSVAERLTFDERIDQASRVIMTPSLILIWSFADPIHPQLLLEAPDDIYCFKFCPTDPNIIAGGCVNGQLVLWDISAHVDRLKTQRGTNKRKNMNSLPGFEDENAMDTPVVRYCAVSSIEHSHRSAVTDLQWVPDHMEVNRMGIPQENKSGQCVQIMTSATDHPSLHWDLYRGKDRDDPPIRQQRVGGYSHNTHRSIDQMGEDEVQRLPGSVLFWDTRPPKVQQQTQAQDKKQAAINNPIGVPTTFKHLDLTWKPLLKVNLPKSEPGGDHSPIKFSIHERQGDRSVFTEESTSETEVSKASEEKKDMSSSMGGGFGFSKPGSGKRTLSAVKTHFYVGTEDGEIVYADWMPQKDQDSGKIQTPKPDWYHTLHDGPIDSLQRSPHFRDVVLCVGGWTLSIWKEGVSSGPLLSSSACSKRLTGGYWSPSRPGVFYITKQDGTVDVWDLLDKTHEPSMTQSVSSAPITCIYPFQVTSKQHLLAVGDALGTLHILEIPWSLRQSTTNELNGVSNYFEREMKRRTFVDMRWDFREKEKIEIEQESKRKAGIAPNVTLTEEEVEQRMKVEYAAFVEEENAFLRSLGLKEEEKEDLPVVD